MRVKSTAFTAFAIINVLAMPVFTGTASAQSEHAVCLRECEGDRQCRKMCGSELNERRAEARGRLQPIRRVTHIKSEVDDRRSAKWIDDVFSPATGGSGGGGGGGGGAGK
jgi:5-deoxy-D-glucuronate isomerase